ncbi:hypothetical protein BDR06DRAFT_1069196 [Suillus hirtellus]|nr:hypothetical protein BDR06DRAFT_1069196 [Suillus hirtellus]
MSQLLDVTIAGINAVQIVIPSDLVKGILGTVTNILITVWSVIKNKSDFQAIVNKCKTIREILERVTKDTTNDNLPRYLVHALLTLNLSVNNINNKVVSRKEQGLLKRFFSVMIDCNQIASWEKDIGSALKLFNIEAITGIAMMVETLTLGLDSNTTSANVLKYHSIEPPSQPSMFYGHDDLVAELTTLVVNSEHIALIGPGGMGKSSLAKSILHEPLIIEKFADQCFFVAYDDLDPSTITFETFMTHFVEALGIEITRADPLCQISTFLHSTSALVVLDNAKTFKEASGLAALKKVPPAIAKIADIHGIILILMSRSRRNATDVLWRMMDILPLDLSAAERVFFQTYPHARCSDAEEEIKDLLRELDFHSLSINLLAHTAQQNDWSPATLLKRWNDWHSAVLNLSKGKLQNLSDIMQLSFNSPSIQALGEDGHHTLAIIVFLPQGLNSNLAGDLLPSLQEVTLYAMFYAGNLLFIIKTTSSSYLYSTLSQLTDTMKISKAAEALYLATGNHEMEYLSEPAKDQVWYFLDDARMYKFTAPADELFVKSWDLKDHFYGLQSNIWHWQAKLYYGGDIVQALMGLAEVAFCEGRLSEAMDILQQIVEMFKGEHSDNVLWYTVLKAIVASKQGDHVLVRELIYQAPESSQFFELHSAFVFLHRSYGMACIKLSAAMVQFGLVQRVLDENREPDHQFGSTKCLNPEPDHRERFSMVQFGFFVVQTKNKPKTNKQTIRA